MIGKNQRGAVLPLIAFCAVAIIAMIAFAMDISFLSGASFEFKRIADATALEILKDYQSTGSLMYNDVDADGNPTCTDECSVCPCPGKCGRMARICAGFDAAKVLVNRNFLPAFSESRFLSRQSDYLDTLEFREDENDSTMVKVDFGLWYFEYSEELDGSQPQCFNGSVAEENFKPCFVKVVKGDLSSTGISSVRVEVVSATNNPIRTRLMSVFGQGLSSARAYSTAAVVPRRGVFVVDITNSTTTGSHDINDAADPSYFSWDLAEPVAAEASLCAGVNSVTMNADCPVCTLAQVDAGTCVATQECRLSDTLELEYRVLLEPGDLLDNHDRDDFACVPVTYNAASRERAYLVDTTTSPEPLRDILKSVNTAMIAFEDRGVGGDALGFVGFDNELLDVRSTGGDFSLVEPGESSFDEFKRATSQVFGPGVNQNTFRNTEFAKFFLFPRFRSDYPRADGSLQVASTYIPLALAKGMEMLKARDGFEAADNFLVVFSDGQSNCLDRGDCANRVGYWKGSRDQAFGSLPDGTSILPVLQRNKIAVHFALIGKDSSPHSRLYKKKGCTEAQAESGEFCCMAYDDYVFEERRNPAYSGWVDYSDPTFDTAADSARPSKPSFYPNSWYDLSAATGGWWIPVRPPCNDSEFRSSSLDEASAKASMLTEFSKACAALGDAEYLDKGAVLAGLRDLFDSSAFDADKVIDGRGRVMCDPMSLSIEEQLSSAIRDQVLGYSPFKLVE